MPNKKEKWLERYKYKLNQFSTSCYEDIEDIKFNLETVLKNNPNCVVLRGRTNIYDGYSQLTKEREPNRIDSHVDWWLFEEADPSNYFERLKE